MKNPTVFFNHPVICESNDTVSRLLAMPTVQPILDYELMEAVLGFYVEGLVKNALDNNESVAYLIKIFLPSVYYDVQESKDSDHLRDVIMSSDEVSSLLHLLSQNYHDVTPQMMQAHFDNVLNGSNSIERSESRNNDTTLSQSQLQEYYAEMSLNMWLELLSQFASD